MTAFQKSVAAALALAALVAGIVLRWQTAEVSAELRARQTERREMLAEMTRLKSEGEELRARQLAAEAKVAEARSNHLELLRLRGEVGALREEKRALERQAATHAAAAAQNRQRPVAPVAAPSVARAASAASPFQLRLVADPAAEGAETLAMQETGDVAGGERSLSVDRVPLLDHTMVRSVGVVKDPDSGRPQIEVQFSEVGRDEFARVTREHLNQRLAIAIDGRVYSAPVIRGEITGGKAVVTGNFSDAEASALAEKINSAVGSP